MRLTSTFTVFCQLSLELSERASLPGEDIKVHIHTNRQSVVCLSAVDKTLHYLRPGYQLNPEEVIKADIHPSLLYRPPVYKGHLFIKSTKFARPHSLIVYWFGRDIKAAKPALKAICV